MSSAAAGVYIHGIKYLRGKSLTMNRIRFYVRIIAMSAVLIAMAFCRIACGHESGIDPSAFEKIDALCQGIVDNGNTPGVALLIGRCYDDKPDIILYQKVYGKRDETELLTTDTLYDLASLTKATFTAPAVMLLIQDGVMSDEDYVYTHIPGFEQHQKGDVKIKHLLTHTSGLPAYTSTSGLPPRPNPDALIDKICGLSKIYNTGEGYVYSCLNYITLARTVENVSGENMHNFLKRRLWDKIGMIDSTFYPTDAQIARTAPTTHSRRGRVHDPLAWYYTDYDAKTHACGNAGGFSTVLDESRLARLLLHKGKLYGKQIYTTQTVWLMTTQQTPVAQRTYGWGVWTSSTYSNPENQTPETCCIGHTGYTGTIMWLDKYSKTYLIMFTNCVYPYDNSENKNAVIAARRAVIRCVLDHLDIYNGVPESAFVVDNDDLAPEYTESGEWTTSTHTGYIGKTYRYAIAGSDACADFHLDLPEGGRYKIYTWYCSGTDRATAAKYIITHCSGSDTVIVNQQENGEQWVFLGTYDFDKAEYTVRLDAKHSAGGNYVISDAIMAECLSTDADIVIDNSDSGYSDTANFFSSSASPYRYGADYRACNPGAGDSATWRLALPRSGVWEIYEWHNGNSTRSACVPFSVTHTYGTDIIYVNEQINSGQWNSIGRYAFRAGSGTVRLSSVPDGIVVADAVKARFVPVEVIVDNLDARYSDTAGFFSSSASPFRYDVDYRACQTGKGEHAMWDLQLPYRGMWEIYEWHNGNETRTPNAPYTIMHAGGTHTVYVNQQESGGQWNSIGKYIFRKGTGSVTLSNECTGGYVIADAIKATYIQPEPATSGIQLY